MYMMVLNALLLMASLTGCCLFARIKTGIQKEFIPLTVFSVLSLLLYAGGLTGQLLAAAFLLYAGGLFLFFYCLFQIRKGRFFLGKPGMFEICFLSIAAFFLFLSLLLKLQHYDNFSHWAVIVKYMLTADQFPSVGDTLIAFKDYPPGISVFLYFICRFLGNDQGIMLAGQNLLLLSGFLAIFGIVREKRRFLVYTFLAMGCAMLSYLNLTIRINNLLVDFHLPIFALAAIAAADSYRNNLKKTAWILVPVLGFLTIMKNTGIFFAAFPILYLIFLQIRQKRLGKSMGYLILILLFSVLPYLLWSHHVDTDLEGIDRKFSAESETEEYAPADLSLHQEITTDFIKAAADLSNRAAVVFFLCHLLVLPLVLWCLLVKRRRLKLLACLLSLDLVVFLYYAGILYLYLYRMPAGEAVVLAGFERYACSILVFFAGGLVLAGVKDIEDSFFVKQVQGDTMRAFSSPDSKHRYQKAVLVTSILLFSFLYSEITGLAEIRRQYAGTIAGQAEALVGDHWTDNREESPESYLVIAPDTDAMVSSYELSYVMKYFLYSSKVKTVLPAPAEELAGQLADYSTAIFFHEPDVSADHRLSAAVSQKKIWDSTELHEFLQSG